MSGFLKGSRGNPFALGMNVSSSLYYNGGGGRTNLLYQSTVTGGTQDSNGFPIAGASSQLLVINAGEYGYAEHKPGNYVVYGTGSGATVTIARHGLSDVVIPTTAGVPFRQVFAVTTFPEPTGDDALNYVVRNWLVCSANSAGSQGIPDLVVCHEDDEADEIAGLEWTDDLLSVCATNSGGPMRMMGQMGVNGGWVRDVADLPVDGDVGNTNFNMNSAGDGPGSTAIRIPSPEALGRLAAQANRPLWINLWPMASDATLAAFFTRLATTYPASLPLWVECGNEPWNNAAGFEQNWRFLRNHYGTASFQNTGLTGNLSAQAQNQMHASLRVWKAAQDVFGSRVVKFFNCMLVSPSQSMTSLNYVDPGILETGVAGGLIADSLGIASYFNLANDILVSDNTNTGRGVTEIPRYSQSMSRRKYIKEKVWVSSAINDNDAAGWFYRAWLNGIDDVAKYIGIFNTALDVQGYPHLSSSYEGGWSHDDTPAFSIGTETDNAGVAAGLGGLCMAFTTATGALVPANATINSFAFTDAATPISDYFEDGDIVRIGFEASTGLSNLRTYKSKTVSGSLYLYTTEANYDADTRVTTGGTGTSVMVANVTRTQALYGFLTSQLWSNPGSPSVLEYFRTKMLAAGLSTQCMFQPVGNVNTLFRDNGTSRPWALKKQWGAADTAAATWYKTRALR